MANCETTDGGPLPIDLEHLSQYTANDPEVTRDVLGIFKDQMELRIQSLHRAVDLASWKHDAHTLKGSALGVGARELAALALEAENLADLLGSAHEDLLFRLDMAASRASTYARQLLEDRSFVG